MNNVGGAGTAARLRRLDEKAEIIMFERGEYVSYANCGLPYYAGGVITERSRLFVMTPEKFKEAVNVDVRVLHDVISINRADKTIRVKDLKTGAERDEYYDVLVLSPGAAPMRPPIPGIDDPAIMTLRSVTDIDGIKARIDDPHRITSYNVCYTKLLRNGEERKTPVPTRGEPRRLRTRPE